MTSEAEILTFVFGVLKILNIAHGGIYALGAYSTATLVPIFYSLGVDIGQGYSKNSIRRFNDFLKTIIEQKNLFFCVRNDGSKKALKKVCESKIFSKMEKCWM